jgi:ureidoglycolate lyase
MTDLATPVHTLVAQPLTPEAFAPFGVTLGPEGKEPRAIDLYGGTIETYTTTFDADLPGEWLITNQRRRPLEARFVERHMRLTQAFFSFGGHPMLVVVAPADAPEERGLPALDTWRAFVVPGTTAVQIQRGVWHEVPFALTDNQVITVMSHRQLTSGLASKPDENGEIDAGDVDKRNVAVRGGTRVVVDLDGAGV